VTFLAYLFAVLKNAVYGTTVFFTSELTQSTDVLDVLALRFLMSAVIFWLLKVTRVCKIRVGVKDFFQKGARRSALKVVLLTALFEPVLYMLFETLGVSMSSNITAGVILSLSAVTSCIFEMIFLKEDSTLAQKIFLGLGIFGAVYIAVNTDTTSGKDSVLGILFLILTVVSGSLFSVFSRKSSRSFGAMEVTYVSCMLGALVFNAVNVVRHLFAGDILHYFDPYMNVDNLIGFAFLAILSTIVATGMNNFALGRMQSSTMAAIGGISTFVTIGVGMLLGGEILETYHIIGLVFILARMIGVSYIAIKRDRQKITLTASTPEKAEE
jgi:drug/metabolite transporter (DMT)-like permease